MISEKAIYSILIILFIGFLYNRWEEKNKDKEQVNGYELVQKYFIGDKKSLGNIKKPFLWIHVTYDWNARKWESFYSRNTLNLNQDYLYLTLRTIIDKYGDDFHICLINDNSFEKLLPYMPMNLAFSSDPLRERLRNLGMAQLLYNFGGITIPISFIANKSIKGLYDNLTEDEILVGELNNNSNDNIKYTPSHKFMGCLAGSPKMLEYVKYLEKIYSNNFTDSIPFNNDTNKWFIANSNNLIVIPPHLLGTKDNIGQEVNIDRLLGSTFIDLCEERIGVYIDKEELLKRTHYNWYVYLDINQVLNSDCQLSKYLLIGQ
jgi:hypothetical protein